MSEPAEKMAEIAGAHADGAVSIVGHHIRTNRWGMGPTTCLRCGEDISKVPVCPLYEPKGAEG